MRKSIICTAALAALAVCVWAGQTRSWVETDYPDFEKGVIKNLSLRSDGRLTLAPRFEELFDSPAAYLWALARDSKGNLYTGGGPGAKLFRVSTGGEKKKLAEFEGSLEVHAIAIDSKDRVYAATSPDGKVYKIATDGKSEVFFDPKTKYIWALAFDSAGDLFVATGDQGEIYRVTPDGHGSVFFKSEETHVRSMAFDGRGNLIIGTEPNGLVMRISPAGEGFVLHEMAKREITAVAVAKDGSIYAAGVGSKQAAAPLAPPPAPVPAVVQVTPGGAGSGTPHVSTPPPSLGSAGAVTISGGSELCRIHPDGYPEKVWSHTHDIIYSIAFDANGRALIGTRNKGYIYRIDSDSLYTALLNAAPTQITALLPGPSGKLFAATGNVGKVYEIGPGLEREGTIESDVFDAGLFSQWGRLSFKGSAAGGRISIETRSGNLDRPQKNWSAWSGAITSEEGARVTSPAARFLQWRATLTVDAADKSGRSPELDAVETAYLARNVAPRIEEIEITPPNYKFPVPVVPTLGSPPTLNLPPLGKRSNRPSVPLSLDSGSTPGMQYAKGATGARWNAVDDNGDSLIYTVEIRGLQETEWKLLKDKVKERYLSWDSTAFPDGEYRLRVTASDLPSNTRDDALSSRLESEVLVIDNTPPHITALAATRNANRIEARWHAADAVSVITKAEYSLDGGDWMVVDPATKLSDSKQLDYTLALKDITPAEHTIAVRVQDEYDNQATDKAVVR